MVDGLDMQAGSHLGEDTSIGSMVFDLRGHDRGKDPPAIFDNGSGGLIARGFDAKDAGRLVHALPHSFRPRGLGAWHAKHQVLGELSQDFWLPVRPDPDRVFDPDSKSLFGVVETWL